MTWNEVWGRYGSRNGIRDWGILRDIVIVVMSYRNDERRYKKKAMRVQKVIECKKKKKKKRFLSKNRLFITNILLSKKIIE